VCLPVIRRTGRNTAADTTPAVNPYILSRINGTMMSMLPITTNNMAMVTGETIIRTEEMNVEGKDTIEEMTEASIRVVIETDLFKNPG
jgi:hypothetical protein